MDDEKFWNPEAEPLPGGPGAHSDEVEFWEDWRDHRSSVVFYALSTAFGALVTYVAVRNAAQVDDLFATLLVGFMLILGGGALTVGVSMPLLLGWELGTVVVRCAREGITIKGATHPWNTVRVLRLGHERVEVGAPNDPEGSVGKRYHVDVCTEGDTLRVTGEIWRSRAHELADVVQRFAPDARVEWGSGLTFRPKGPSRAERPSRKRMRGEAVALVGASIVFSVLVLAAASYWAPQLLDY